MRLADRDDLLQKTQRLTRTTPLPKAIDSKTAALIDQLQRQIGELGGFISSILQHVFAGPLFAPGSTQNFLIDARTGTTGYNVLSAAQAAAEGLPSAAGFVIFRHQLGILLNRAVVTHWALNDPRSFNESAGTSAPAGQAERSGGVRIYGWDERRTVFQLDSEAEVQKVVAIVALFPATPEPLSSNRMRELAVGGRASPSPGLILAGSVTAETVEV